MSSPELAVRQLARLPSNCTCPNCGTWSRYGFSSVCMKYLTFVCDKCKSSHQAISHRCKSLTMSSWDHGEALKLKVHGNDYARKVWLATAPPPGVGGRPSEGDDIDVFKRFVVDTYERRRYYREPSSSDGGGDKEQGTDIIIATSNPKGVALVTEKSAMQSNAPTLNAAPVHTPATTSPVVVDLLDFGAFDSPAPQPAPAVNSSLPGAVFFDPFNTSTSMPQDASSISTSSAASANNSLSNNNNDNCKSIANQMNGIMSFDVFAPSLKESAMADSDSSMQLNNSTSDPFSVLSATPAMSTSTLGMFSMNPNSASNFSNHNYMMKEGTSNFAKNNMMMMNGGIGMMNNSNAITMNGNYSVMNSSTATVMTAVFNNSIMHNNGVNTAMMNPTFSGGVPGNMQQQFPQNHHQQSAIMNTHAGPSMFNNNSISNSFSGGITQDMKNAAASARSTASTKPDPFAGLTGL